MKRKAQIAGQVFIYIIAVVVVGLIIAYGYSAIKNFGKKGEQVEFITLKSDVENSVSSIMSDFGSIKRPNLNVPGKYEKVCFADKSKELSFIENSPMCKITEGQKDDFEPIACEGWKTKRDNVFLIPDGSERFDAGEIRIDPLVSAQGYLCFKVVNNKIKLQLQGKGDHVLVSTYE